MRSTFICAKPPVNRCVLSTILSLALTTGCLTRAGGALDPIDPVPPPVPGLVEETVGDFAFTLEGGKMVSSAQMGRELNNGSPFWYARRSSRE